MIKSKTKKLLPQYGVYSLIAVTATVFLAINLSYTFNLPYARDDAYIYFEQYLNYKGGEISIWQHLFGITLYPHPKLTSRILAFVSVWVLDEVNFEFFQIIGILAYTAIPFIMAYLSRVKKPLILLLLSSLFWIPITNMFWSISITSLPFFYIGSFFMFYYHSKQNIKISLGLALIVLFSSGQGFMSILCLLVKSVLDLLRKRMVSHNLIYISVSIVLLVLWFFAIYCNGKQLNHGQDIDVTVIEKIYYFIKFPFAFISNTLSHFITFETPMLCLFVVMLTHYVYMLLTEKCIITDNIAGLILFMGFVASISRLDQIGYSVEIPNRYVIHSIIFFSCYIIKFQHSKNTLIIILSLLCLAVGINRATDSYPKYSKLKNIKSTRIKDMLIDNRTKQYIKIKKLNYFSYIERALDSGIYNLPEEVFSQENIISIPKKIKTNSTGSKLTHVPTRHYNMLYWRKSKSAEQYVLCLGKEDKKLTTFDYSNKKSYVLRKEPFQVDFNKCILQSIDENGTLQRSKIEFE